METTNAREKWNISCRYDVVRYTGGFGADNWMLSWSHVDQAHKASFCTSEVVTGEGAASEIVLDSLGEGLFHAGADTYAVRAAHGGFLITRSGQTLAALGFGVYGSTLWLRSRLTEQDRRHLALASSMLEIVELSRR